MELKGSRTEANLMAAFAGESQARNKYTYYASKAKKDGYVQIANIFEDCESKKYDLIQCTTGKGTRRNIFLPVPLPVLIIAKAFVTF